MIEEGKSYARAREISAGAPLSQDPLPSPSVPEKLPPKPLATGTSQAPDEPTAGRSTAPQDDSQTESFLVNGTVESDESAQQKRGVPSVGASQTPNSKGRYVNIGIQAAGAAAGNVAGGAVAGAAGATAGAGATVVGEDAAGALASTAKGAAAGAGKGTGQEVGTGMAKDTLKGGAKSLSREAASQAKNGGQGSWGDLAKDAGGSVKDGAKSTSSINPLSDDDRTRTTRARDELKERTGVDADQAVGAVAGGAASAAAVASGAGAPLAGAAGAAGNALGTGLSRAAHTVSGKFVGARKTATIAAGGMVALLMVSMMGLFSTSTSSIQQQEEAKQAIAAYGEQQAQQSEEASASCAVQQEFPFMHYVPTSRLAAVRAISSAASSAGVDSYGMVIAVAVASANSELKSSAGDDSSAGMFMFPVSEANGTKSELQDPAYSATLFFAKLQAIVGWQDLPLSAVAAQIVPTAYPDSYGALESSSREAINQSGGAVGAGCEALGIEFSCPAVAEMEVPASGVFSTDSRNLARCLWDRQSVRGISSGDANGKSIVFPLTGAVDLAAALEAPGSPSAQVSPVSAASVVSWLISVKTTFGIKGFEYNGQRVDFTRDPENPYTIVDVSAVAPPAVNPPGGGGTGPSADAQDPTNILSGSNSNLGKMRVFVYGSAGTGRIPKGESSGLWTAPIAGGFRISSEYGMRYHPTLHIWRLHAGTDFAVGAGTPVVAVADGTVKAEFYSSTGGNILTIDYGNGVTSNYLHLTSYVAHVGDTVTAGQVVAYSGNTGSATTGAHLHFEILINGTSTNARAFLTEKGVSLP